jgi:glycosyltransferase involved in cell wall biosynthesis
LATPLVSTVIPTFNRRDFITRAVDSAFAQTYTHQEVIVVDDGSTDGTEQLLRERYGERIRYVAQPNGGVSNARNHGMRLARGELIALLDSDDEWEPSKLEKQVEFLSARPDYGMVLTDVRRVDGQRRPIDVFRRRDVIRTDGDVLLDLLLNPSLVPASVLFRRQVFERLGGFDETLRTAEDIEFHLRIAAAFKIGVIEEGLTIAMRGHDGLSNAASSDSDYARVVEQFIAAQGARIPARIRRSALFMTYERNARSAHVSHRSGSAWGYTGRALLNAGTWNDLLAIQRVVLLGARVLAARAARRLGLRTRRA